MASVSPRVFANVIGALISGLERTGAIDRGEFERALRQLAAQSEGDEKVVLLALADGLAPAGAQHLQLIPGGKPSDPDEPPP